MGQKEPEAITKTSVICVKKANLVKLGFRDLLHWLEDPNHVYIGRNMSFYVKGAKASIFANPFSVKKYGRDECLAKYKTYLLENTNLMEKLETLRGKTLGCWCHNSNDKPKKTKPFCHGDVIVEILSL